MIEPMAGIAAAAVTLLALCGLGRSARWRAGLMALAVLPTVAAVLVEGLRVPAVGVYLAAVVAAVLAGTVRRRHVVVGPVAAVLALVVAVPSVLLPPLTVPSTAESVPVGSRSYEWTDADRIDPYTGSSRRVQVEVWYPADPDSAASILTADYPEQVPVALGTVLGTGSWPFAYLTRADTAVHPDAAPADGDFPVVLYSPGNGSTRFQNLDLVQRMVSAGYVVVGVDHPSTAASLTFADGSTTVATAEPPTAGGTEDDIIDIRAEDLSFVLDQLSDLDHLDLSRVAAVGHSYGGATAGEAAARDDRIDAVVAMDGTMWGSTIFDTGLHVPLLYVQATGTVDAFSGPDVSPEDAAYAEQAKRGLNQIVATTDAHVEYALVERANHYTFTDLALLGPVFSAGRSGEDAAGLTGDLVIGFLDERLRDTGEGTAPAVENHTGIDLLSDPDTIFPDLGSTR